MSYRRRLLTAGIAGSLCWIAFWVWHYATTCSLQQMGGGRAITCRWETTENGAASLVAMTAPAGTVLWDMAARTIGIPAGAFLAGIALFWVIERFRGMRR